MLKSYCLYKRTISVSFLKMSHLKNYFLRPSLYILLLIIFLVDWFIISILTVEIHDSITIHTSMRGKQSSFSHIPGSFIRKI